MDALSKGTSKSLAARTSTYVSGYLPNSLSTSRVCCLLNYGLNALKAPEGHLPFMFRKLRSRMILKAVRSFIFLSFESCHQWLFSCVNVYPIECSQSLGWNKAHSPLVPITWFTGSGNNTRGDRGSQTRGLTWKHHLTEPKCMPVCLQKCHRESTRWWSLGRNIDLPIPGISGQAIKWMFCPRELKDELIF